MAFGRVGMKDLRCSNVLVFVEATNGSDRPKLEDLGIVQRWCYATSSLNRASKMECGAVFKIDKANLPRALVALELKGIQKVTVLEPACGVVLATTIDPSTGDHVCEPYRLGKHEWSTDHDDEDVLERKFHFGWSHEIREI